MPTMKRIRLGFLMVFCPAFAFAHGRLPVPNVPPRLTESINDFQFHPFEDDNGGFYLIWTSAASSGSIPSLLAQHMDAQGNAQWAKPLLVSRRVDTADGWEAFADGQGGGVVTWVRNGALFARRFGSDGRLTWSDELAISLSSGAVQTPNGVADSSGGAYIVWAQELYPRRAVLLMQHLNAAGKTLWKEADMRVSRRSSDQRSPTIVTDGQGGAFIAWNDDRSQSSQLELQRMDSIGDRLLGEEGLLITAPAPADSDAPVAEPFFEQGHVVLAWAASQNARNRIFLQRVDGPGHLLWTPQGIAASVGSSNQWDSVLSEAGDGSLWVAWEDYRDGNRWRGFLTRLDAQGQPAWKTRECAITDVDADQGDLAIADDGQNGVFAAWYDDRTGDSGLYYQDFDASGQNRLPPDGKNLVHGLKDPLTPELLPLNPGHIAVLWANHPRKGLWGLYWSVVDNHSL